MNDDRLWCDECGEQIRVVEGVTAFKARGYWWCAKHAKIAGHKDGKPVAAFPSPGKLRPATIFDVETTK